MYLPTLVSLFCVCVVVYGSHVPELLQHGANIGTNGLPIDTPEVQQAKNFHFNAHFEALTNEHKQNGNQDYYNVLNAFNPVQLPAASTGLSNNGIHALNHFPTLDQSSHNLQHIPVTSNAFQNSAYKYRNWQNYLPATIGYNGLPLNTPEVELAKAQHLGKVAEETLRNQWLKSNYNNGDGYGYNTKYQATTGLPNTGNFVTSYQNSNNQHGSLVPSNAFSGLQFKNSDYEYRKWQNHLPATIGYNGLPLNTPEVELAKAQHLRNVAQETLRNFYLKSNDNNGYEYDNKNY